MERAELRIAIVDDNRDAVLSLAKLLTLTGFRVVVQTTDPAQALDRILQERPHIVLLDIGMPFIDGYTLATRIREHLVPVPKLIAVTGYGKDEDKTHAAEAGFDAHFVKPVNWQKLEALLLAYLTSDKTA
jgi:two-component system, sensor histidine kinase